MIIKYKYIIYDLEMNVRETDIYEKKIDENMLFPDFIDLIVKEDNIKHFQVVVEDLATKTWGKIFDYKMLNYMKIDDYHYKWLNEKIIDIEQTFSLFDDVLNIVIDGPGIGGLLCEENGIKYTINSNEKDRHEFEPHVHCKYSGEKTRINIETLEFMDKKFKNPKKNKEALKWVKENQEQLLNYYNEFVVKGNSKINFFASN